MVTPPRCSEPVHRYEAPGKLSPAVRLTFVHAGPVPRPPDWAAHVHTSHTEAELAALRLCAARGAPFGAEAWVGPTAARLSLECTLRPRSRPLGQRTDTKAAPP